MNFVNVGKRRKTVANAPARPATYRARLARCTVEYSVSNAREELAAHSRWNAR